MAFQCVVVTPEQQAVDESISQAIIPLHDGMAGVMTGRAPLLAKLGLGPLRLDLPGGGHKLFLIDGGIVQMKGNRLTILTESAIPAEALNAETGRAEYAQALASKITDEASFEKRDHDMRRGQLEQRLAGSSPSAGRGT